jgi:hypothetical protein
MRITDAATESPRMSVRGICTGSGCIEPKMPALKRDVHLRSGL